jgi:hypothetical protein
MHTDEKGNMDDFKSNGTVYFECFQGIKKKLLSNAESGKRASRGA